MFQVAYFSDSLRFGVFKDFIYSVYLFSTVCFCRIKKRMRTSRENRIGLFVSHSNTDCNCHVLVNMISRPNASTNILDLRVS